MKYIVQLAVLLFVYAPPSWGAPQTFENLIRCQSDLGYDSYCKASTGMLLEAQPFHSTFFMTYDMSCDPGLTSPRPSALKLVIHTENGQKNERMIAFKSVETLEPIDGFGPIELIDIRPSELNSKHYQPGCNLSITIEKSKSQRTLQQERERMARIDGYLLQAERVSADEFRLMMLFHADIMRTARDKALACVIRKSESDPLYLDIASELKLTYLLIFGEEYSSAACVDQDAMPEIIDDCSPDSGSQLCVYKQAYFKSRQKIQEIIITLQSYRNDPANASFYDRIQALTNRIGSQLGSM